MPSATRAGIRQIADASDFNGNLTEPEFYGYALVWDGTEFTLGDFDAAGAAGVAISDHLVAANPHTQYLLSSSYTAADVLSKLLTVDGSGSLLDADFLDGQSSAYYLPASSYTAADVLSKLLTVDGTGSGLDADLLDGQSSAYYLPAASFVPPGSTTQVLFNDGGVFGGDAGLTYAKTTDRLTVAGGLIAPSMRPASDSTTALQLQNAAGTAVVTMDTTNQRFGVGTSSPVAAFHIVSSGNGPFILQKTGSTGFSISSFYPSLNINMYNDNTQWRAIGNGYVGAWGQDPTTGLMFFGNSTASATAGAALGSNPIVTYLVITSIGYVGISSGTPTALLDIAASTTTRASLRIREAGTRPTTPNAGDAWNDGAIGLYQISATTNAIVNSLKLERASSGTPAAGFGLGIAARLHSTTTQDQDAGRLTWQWNDATHASRAAKGRLTAYNVTTERECIAWAGGSSAAQVGFLGATPTARTSAYTPTNVTTDRSYDANATTLDELADVLGTLIADLQLFGLLG